MPRTDVIAGLDIGTTKICCVVAELNDANQLIISGVGVSPSGGLKDGAVVDIESTVHAIESAVEQASRQAGKEIHSVYVGITGKHISSLNSKGVTAITHPNREITHSDVERVKEQARVIVLPPDRLILHAIPRSYSIDGQAGIRQPEGMSGMRLEVETHIVTGARTFVDNVEKCVTRAGLNLDDMVLEPLATGEAVLSNAERSQGVCLVDIGGGTSDLAIFQGGSIFYSSVIPIGGNHVTNDLAQLLRMTVEEAERIKIANGHCVLKDIRETESVAITQIGKSETRPLKRRAVVEIIEARMQEIFAHVQKEIEKSGCKDMLPAGLVISGGGSQLKGAQDLAQNQLEMPVRIGSPSGLMGLADAVYSPTFSTAVGLVQYGVNDLLQSGGPSGGIGTLSGVSKFFNGIMNRFGTR
ncbi:MAG: cell division protein FtsA [Chthonomonadales bacterium]